MQILFNEKARLLDYYHMVHVQFTKLAMSQPTFIQIIQLLEQLIENPVALFNNQRELVCATIPWGESPILLKKEGIQQQDYMTYSYEMHWALLDKDSGEKRYLLTAKVPNIGNDYYYLTVVQRNKGIENMDYMAIENAISFLQMELIKKFAISEVQQNYMNDLIDDLMTGKITSREKMRDALEYLRLSYQEQYRVVVIQLLPQNSKWDETQYKKHMKRFVDKFQSYWQQSLYRIRSDRIILILQSTSFDIRSFKKKIAEIVPLVLGEFAFDTFHYRIVISEQGSVTELHKYSIQVLKAIHLTGIIRVMNLIFSQGTA